MPRGHSASGPLAFQALLKVKRRDDGGQQEQDECGARQQQAERTPKSGLIARRPEAVGSAQVVQMKFVTHLHRSTLAFNARQLFDRFFKFGRGTPALHFVDAIFEERRFVDGAAQFVLRRNLLAFHSNVTLL